MCVSSDGRRVVRLPDTTALHARPAGLLVRTAAPYDASVTLHANGRCADAKSILQVMALGASGGATVELEATGPAASDALDAIAVLLETLE